ncbi:hypothetical protein KHQ81_09260 [Mycoplasmatota bacterium]|nr:hypothetical protein KHQ81_09260 [Mycoplasmatota bacterium]
MSQFLYVLFAIIPLAVILLIIYVIIQTLRKKNKGDIDYGNSSLNILDNDTTVDDEQEEK